MSSIIPHRTLIEKRRWKFLSTVPCGFLWDYGCEWRVLLISLRVKVALSVNNMNVSNWRLVCNQWQNSRRMAVSPGCRVCTRCGWNGYKPSSCSVSWNTETCRNSSRAGSRTAVYHLKNVFLSLNILLTCSFRWNMSTGQRATFTQCTEHFGKHSTIRNSAHTKLSTVFFDSSSGTTIAEAVNG